jgi:hypothetical protein
MDEMSSPVAEELEDTREIRSAIKISRSISNKGSWEARAELCGARTLVLTAEGCQLLMFGDFRRYKRFQITSVFRTGTVGG